MGHLVEPQTRNKTRGNDRKLAEVPGCNTTKSISLGEHFCRRQCKGFAVEEIEGVAKINLQQSKIGFSVLMEHITERMRHSFNPPRTTNTKVLPLKHIGDITFSSQAETFSD